MKRLQIATAISALALICGSAYAQNPEFLEGNALKEQILSKPFVYIREGDNEKVGWDIRSNGYLYGRNYSRNTGDTARWTIEDNKLCVQWRGNSKDGCFGMMREDGKLKTFTGSKDAPVVHGVETN